MNKDFSIESSIEKIHNSKTKEYFNEVYQTFVNENYRSSTVMLYSVLICDLIFKLKDLRDIYKDSIADKILKEIEKSQEEKPKSPEWENILIESIKTRMTLLEASDIVTIESLQKYRHISAHPILTNSDLLYSPDKDTVRSLIRNILEGVLINPPFFSNKIFDTFLNDLSDIKDKINDIEDLKAYLKSRYLNKMKDSVYKKIFRSLWKVVFITEDTYSQNNKVVNYNTLIIFLENNEKLCIDMIIDEPDYFGNISIEESLDKLTSISTKFPKVYSNLKSSLQLLLKKHIEQNDNLILISWFLNESLDKHWMVLNKVNVEYIKEKYFIILKNLAIQNSCYDNYIEFIIDYFGKSNSYDSTQDRYENALLTIIDDVNIQQFKNILFKADKNNQIYHRIGMPKFFKVIIEEKFKDLIQEKDYKHLFR